MKIGEKNFNHYFSGQKAQLKLDNSKWKWSNSPLHPFILHFVAIGIFFAASTLRK